MGRRATFRISVLTSCASAVLAVAAHAADPGPIATAPSVNDSPSATRVASSLAPDPTAKQISAWISADGESVVTQEGDQPAVRQPRQIHGEIDGEAGTGGYHGVAGMADIPVGQNGDLLVAGYNSSGRFRGGPGFQNNSLAVGLFLDGTKPAPSCARPRFGLALPTWQGGSADCPTSPSAANQAPEK